MFSPACRRPLAYRMIGASVASKPRATMPVVKMPVRSPLP